MHPFEFVISDSIPNRIGPLICGSHPGGFQLEFVDISWVINHMTCYNLSAVIGGKENPLQDLLSSLNAVI